MINITHDDWRYLSVQVGHLADWKDDPSWRGKYEQHLNHRFRMIAPALPSGAVACMDIGGGLSGTSILMNRAYGNELTCDVIDGDGPPIVINHALPFSSHEQTKTFLMNNGVRKCDVFFPHRLPRRHYEIIMSFRAWCFHIELDVYAPWVRTAMRPGSVLIVDVRKDKPAYMRGLQSMFQNGKLLGEDGKGEIWAFNS